ncbi:amino acid adenylation domain-containing protein [Mesorhizobium sp. B1-1-1]|uniref:amino acid adenylation domain-containing protein n=1 Tax=Mesorhizobium sp. B1-1-1 TaxID=2589983 RepID=UPI00112BA510|nr:amino acid adenylation domain-containing protein [Mesorhizobium sp. B1-1-1]TPN63597.1 amino acid adenylation domain-containing protein [Mesorhizobium sp. B1-1-1]
MNSQSSHNGPFASFHPATLPFEGVRSRVYSDKLATASLTLSYHAGQVPYGNAQLLAAVATVLARYESADDVSLGVCERGVAVGVSLSTPGARTLASLETQAAAVLAEVIWDPLSFGRQVSLADLTAVANRNPLFGVLVVLDHFAAPSLRHDVALRFDNERALVADYNARVLRAETVERFLGHVACTLVALHQTPSATILGTHFLGDDEAVALDALAGGGDPAFDGTVQDLVAAALTGPLKHPVIEFGNQSWSLAQLMGRADEIGVAISTRIRSKGARIGIALQPGPDQIAALIATIRLCGVIVPLDTTLPTARQAAIREQANLTAVVTENLLAVHFKGMDPIVLEHLPSEMNGAARPIEVGSSTPDDPLYLMFTSGSTGLPKGVEVPHRTLANLITCEDRRRSIRGKRTLGRTSIAFDVGLQEIFATILFGGTLVIAADNERADIGALASLIADCRIARIYLPPVALHQMAEAADAHPTALDNLEEVIVAGEQLRISQAIRRFFRATTAQLINQYGPTETHVATEAILDQAPLRWLDLPAIGRPIPGVRAYVVNAAGKPQPLLIAGELLVGGVAPALGYPGLPDLTHDRFIRDPTTTNSEAMVYRTGDRARWLSDGCLEFLGRQDDQVKVRGYRVELGDLEANAESLPGVQLAAAKYWTTDTWTGLALYLVLNDYSRASLRELRDALRDRVPEYMVPRLSAMMLLDKLPLSSSGKVDRAQLPHPGASEGPALYGVTPADRVAAIWKRRIGLGQIGLDDDFLELGGHSLLAIQIVSEVNDALGIGVPLSTLLRGTSLRAFTEVVEGLLAARAVGTVHNQTSAGREVGPSTIASESEVASPVNFVDLPDGKFATVSAAEARHLWTEIFTQNAYRHPAFHYQPGATIVDVGANIGIFSRYALHETGGCRLIAIEPAFELFNCLKQNLAQVETQLDLLHLGCGEVDVEELNFSYFPQVPSMSSFAPDRTKDKALLGGLLANDPAWSSSDGESAQGRFLEAAFEARQQNSRCRRISTILRTFRVDNVGLLKIDVQRGEQEVLRGIEPEDWGKISQVVIELQDHAGRAESTMTFLKLRGYAVDVGSIPLHRGTDVRFIYGWRI